MATILDIPSSEAPATSREKINDNFDALNTELIAATSAVAGKAATSHDHSGQVLTPTSVNGVVISGGSTPTLAVTGTTAVSGTNTGDNATNSQYAGLVSNATHTGDATGATALTLATVNSNVGSFTLASITVNAKGLVTAASNGPSLGDAALLDVGTGSGDVAAGDHTHTGVYAAASHNHSGDALTPSTVNSVVISGSSTPTLAVTGTTAVSGTNTGDNATNTQYSGLVTNATHTGDATGSTALTLATVNSNVGSFGSATAAGTFTVNAKGLVTAAGSTTVTPAVGSITGLGTGVATALAVAVGSAGAPVVFNGAGGTPSSLTLTNATGLPTAGLVDDAVTLAKMAAGTAGNLITYDASGNPAAVATGTATHVLTSNGAGAAPTFQAIPGGGGGASAATNAETMAGVSTSLAVTPMELFRQWAHLTLCIPSNNLYTSSYSGTGATVNIKYQARQVIGPNASTAGYAIATRTNDNCHIWNVGPGMRPGYVKCSRTICYFGISHFSSTPVSGVVVRSIFGNGGTSVGNPSVRSIGWRKTGAGALELIVHDGTSLTAVTSSFTPTTDEAFSWQVTNDGSGNCALYVNGTSVATSSAGPSGSGNEYGAAYNGTIVSEEIDCSAGTHSSSLNVNWINGGFSVGA